MTKDQVRSTEEAFSTERALKLARHTLNTMRHQAYMHGDQSAFENADQAINAIEQALLTATPLAAPVQEPVATVQSLHVDGKDIGVQAHLHQHLPVGTKLYTTPPNVATPLASPVLELAAERFEAMHANDDVWITTISAAQLIRSLASSAAQRQWVGLTEIDAFEKGSRNRQALICAVEAKLKEKNT